MPRFTATIEIDLDEPSLPDAQQVAQEITTEICNHAFLTNIARVVVVVPTPDGDGFAWDSVLDSIWNSELDI